MKQIIKEGGEASRTSILLKNIFFALGFTNIVDFQAKKGLVIDGLFGSKSFAKLYEEMLAVEEVPSFEGYHYEHKMDKKQIVLHHTAGSDNALGVYEWWKQDRVAHVGTAIVIDRSGKVFRGFDESKWAFHIGSRRYGHQLLEQHSVAVELNNWGQVQKRADDKFYTYIDNFGVDGSGQTIPSEDVCQIPDGYKGYHYFQDYTDAQIKSLENWILLMSLRFDIPLTYHEDRLWQCSEDAYRGVPGIYTHNSYDDGRMGKVDIYRHPKMVKMLQDLSMYQSP